MVEISLSVVVLAMMSLAVVVVVAAVVVIAVFVIVVVSFSDEFDSIASSISATSACLAALSLSFSFVLFSTQKKRKASASAKSSSNDKKEGDIASPKMMTTITASTTTKKARKQEQHGYDENDIDKVAVEDKEEMEIEQIIKSESAEKGTKTKTTKASKTEGFWGLSDEVISNMERCREMLECEDESRKKELLSEHRSAQLPMWLRTWAFSGWPALTRKERYMKSNILAVLSCYVDAHPVSVLLNKKVPSHKIIPKKLREPAWNRIVDTDINSRLLPLRNDPDIFLARLHRPDFREKWYPVAAEELTTKTCQQFQHKKEEMPFQQMDSDSDDSNSDAGSVSNEFDDANDQLPADYCYSSYEASDDESEEDFICEGLYEDDDEGDATYNSEHEAQHGRPRRLQVPKCLWNNKKVMQEVFFFYPEILHQRKEQKQRRRHTAPSAHEELKKENHLESKMREGQNYGQNGKEDEKDNSSPNIYEPGDNLPNAINSFGGTDEGCRCDKKCPQYCPGCCSFDGCDFSYLGHDQCPCLIDLDCWRDDKDMLCSLLSSPHCRQTIQPIDILFFSDRIRSDPHLMLECFRNIPNRPKYLHKTLRDDKEFWMQRVVVPSTPTMSFLADLSLRDVSQRLRADFDVVRSFCLHFHGTNLRRAAYPLRRNLELIQVACQQTPEAVLYAFDEISANEQQLMSKPFVLQMFQNEDYWDISARNKNTRSGLDQQQQKQLREVKTQLSKVLQNLWKKLSPKLQNDIDVVTAHAKAYYQIRKPAAFEKDFPFDKKWLLSLEFCRSILRLNPFLWLSLDMEQQKNDELTILCARNFGVVEISIDRLSDILSEKVEEYGEAIFYLSIISLMIKMSPDRAEKLFTDFEVLKFIVSSCDIGETLDRFIGPYILQLPRNVCLELCRLNVRFYEVLCLHNHDNDPDLCQDHDILEAALEYNPRPDTFERCEKVFTRYFGQHFKHRYPDLVAKYFRAAREAGYSILEILAVTGILDEDIYAHHCVALAWIECSRGIPLGVFPEEYKKDRSLLLAMAKTFPRQIAWFLPKSLLVDKSFLIQLCEISGFFWYYIVHVSPKLEQDVDLMMAAFVGDHNMVASIKSQRDDSPELLTPFAKEVRERLMLYYSWITFLLGISSSLSSNSTSSVDHFVSSDSCCWKGMLDQGNDTSLALKRLIGDYVGAPKGKEVEKLRFVSDNLVQWGY